MNIKITIDLPDDEIAREAVVGEFTALANAYAPVTKVRKAVRDIIVKLDKELKACLSTSS